MGARFQTITLRTIVVSFAAWCAFGIFDAAQTVAVMKSEGMHHHWGTLFGVCVADWLPWAVCTPLVLHAARRFPIDAWRTPQMWLAHGTGAVSVGLVFSAWTAFLEVVFDPYGNGDDLSGFGHTFANKFLSGMLTAAVLYSFVVIVQYAMQSRERAALRERDAARLAEQLSAARLESLRRQIEPHFLFNALSAVAGLIREERGEAAIATVVSLSDFLRRAIDGSARQLIPLGEELDVVEQYLQIQKIRFGERLSVAIDVPVELRAATVPNLILQPIVENAIKHGIAKRLRGGTISISASAAGGMLALDVSNDGPGLVPGWDREGDGVGFAHVRERLETLYGRRWTLTMADDRQRGVDVRMSFPFVAHAGA